MESGDKLKIDYWKIRGLVRSIVFYEMAGAPYKMIYYDLLTKMNSSMLHIIGDEDEYSFWIIFIQISIYWKLYDKHFLTYLAYNLLKIKHELKLLIFSNDSVLFKKLLNIDYY